jgi:hypothetical protein
VEQNIQDNIVQLQEWERQNWHNEEAEMQYILEQSQMRAARRQSQMETARRRSQTRAARRQLRMEAAIQQSRDETEMQLLRGETEMHRLQMEHATWQSIWQSNELYNQNRYTDHDHELQSQTLQRPERRYEQIDMSHIASPQIIIDCVEVLRQRLQRMWRRILEPDA